MGGQGETYTIQFRQISHQSKVCSCYKDSHRDPAEPGAVHGPAPRVHQETDHEVSLGRRVHVATAEAAAGVRGVVVAAAAVCPRLRWKEGGRHNNSGNFSLLCIYWKLSRPAEIASDK